MLLVEQNVEARAVAVRPGMACSPTGPSSDAGPVADLLAGRPVADAYLGGLDLHRRRPNSPPTTRPTRAIEEVDHMITTEEWTFAGTHTEIARGRGATPAIAPRYVALLVHGYGEHIGRYEHVAAALVAHGAACTGPTISAMARAAATGCSSRTSMTLWPTFTRWTCGAPR